MGSISSSSTVTQAMISANTCSIVSSRSFFSNKFPNFKKNTKFVIRASTEEVDCNVEECAPDKEVGKVSMEWLAGEKTKVVGTFPPKKKGWTGYVEKDTAGQTNIYSIEPAVYVAESAISSGNAGTSADGAENTAGLAAFLALISVAAASSILLQVGKNSPPPVQTIDYSGPSLTYYINKFKPVEAQVEPSPSVQTEVSAPEVSAPEVSAPEVSAPEVSAPEVSQAEINSENPQEPAISSETTAS